MKTASFFVSCKKYNDNSSLPWSVLILRDVLLHGGEYVHTSVNCQRHPHPSLHLLIPYTKDTKLPIYDYIGNWDPSRIVSQSSLKTFCHNTQSSDMTRTKKRTLLKEPSFLHAHYGGQNEWSLSSIKSRQPNCFRRFQHLSC